MSYQGTLSLECQVEEVGGLSPGQLNPPLLKEAEDFDGAEALFEATKQAAVELANNLGAERVSVSLAVAVGEKDEAGYTDAHGSVTVMRDFPNRAHKLRELRREKEADQSTEEENNGT